LTWGCRIPKWVWGWKIRYTYAWRIPKWSPRPWIKPKYLSKFVHVNACDVLRAFRWLLVFVQENTAIGDGLRHDLASRWLVLGADHVPSENPRPPTRTSRHDFRRVLRSSTSVADNTCDPTFTLTLTCHDFLALLDAQKPHSRPASDSFSSASAARGCPALVRCATRCIHIVVRRHVHTREWLSRDRGCAQVNCTLGNLW